MKARVVMATILGEHKWRVYYDQLLIATFVDEDWAQKYADYLNANY